MILRTSSTLITIGTDASSIALADIEITIGTIIYKYKKIKFQMIKYVNIDIGYTFVCERNIRIGCVDCNPLDHNCQNSVSLLTGECKILTSFNSSDTKVYSVFVHGVGDDEKNNNDNCILYSSRNFTCCRMCILYHSMYTA